METIEWNEEQRKAFQDLLREFVALIDAKVQEKKQMGKKPKIPKYASCQNGLNKFLAPWGYACKISLGTGLLSHEPSIAFCRQDILGEGFVNGEKPTPTKGFYLWFAYYWRNDLEKIDLCIGRSDEEDKKEECQKCLAYDKIIPNRNECYREL
ncbi:putative [Helicobacter pylori J99]|uniref:Putative n=1 Tax=Helicobacter pylori (strain J99 / ATCC 700824) TaxID=85963 RepID=Q9ZMW5_HELPJ|nr:putative [Helicobacter pylori J99]